MKEDIKFYGSVTVSERGQIVIPAQARRDLSIEIGDRVLVIGGPKGGLLFMKTDIVSRVLTQWAGIIHQVETEVVDRPDIEDRS